MTIIDRIAKNPYPFGYPMAVKSYLCLPASGYCTAATQGLRCAYNCDAYVDAMRVHDAGDEDRP